MENTICNLICIQVQKRDFIFTLNTTFLEVRKKIAQDIYGIENGYVELYNQSPRIYKDYGKFFFDNGVIPYTFDYYPLSDITIGGRTFIFNATLEEPKRDIYLDSKIYPELNLNQEQNAPNVSNKLYHDKFKNPYSYKKQKTEDSKSFVYNEDDFPSL